VCLKLFVTKTKQKISERMMLSVFLEIIQNYSTSEIAMAYRNVAISHHKYKNNMLPHSKLVGKYLIKIEP
jgi:hypothetical protein